MGFHDLLGPGHLYENSSLLTLYDRREHGIFGIWAFGSKRASAQVSPVGLGIGHFDSIYRFRLDALSLRILELLHPAVYVGFHASRSAAPKIKENSFPCLPGFSGNGKLGFAHFRRRRGRFPVRRSRERIARYLQGVGLKGTDKETQEDKWAKD